MKKVILSLAVFLTATVSLAAEITPDSLIGRYKVQAKIGFQKVYVNFRVLNTNEFEIQRTYESGRGDEVCNGKYNINPSLFWDDLVLAKGKSFNGVFTCPSNRSRDVNFNINFQDKTTEDLVKGTSVIVTSSMAPGRSVKAYVKKQ